jgi:hypothetical protein
VADTAGDMYIINTLGGAYRELWCINRRRGGVSIKLSKAKDQTNVIQFEYNLVGDKVF